MTRPYGTAPVTLADGRMAYERNAARPLDPPRPTLAPAPSRRGTIRLTLLIAVGVFALALLGRGFGVN